MLACAVIASRLCTFPVCIAPGNPMMPKSDPMSPLMVEGPVLAIPPFEVKKTKFATKLTDD